MSDTTPGHGMAHELKRITALDAVHDLMDWVQGADIEALAELYSLKIANDSTDAVQIECEGDESNWFVRGKMMRVQLVPA